ncbi:hypothetical protein SASPL_141110 [Salvia splendens]|uniref:Uncharacterized protein n=1 Tax=Salvia splendens TaxID=180675 RepID=A0A8X8ZD42_SALSN|nr:hypothetical protein SASPL_141110 [Salvia splendens]
MESLDRVFVEFRPQPPQLHRYQGETEEDGCYGDDFIHAHSPQLDESLDAYGCGYAHELREQKEVDSSPSSLVVQIGYSCAGARDFDCFSEHGMVNEMLCDKLEMKLSTYSISETKSETNEAIDGDAAYSEIGFRSNPAIGLPRAQDLSCEKIVGVLLALPQKEVVHSFIKWRKENYFNGKVDLVLPDEINEKSNKTKIEFFFTFFTNNLRGYSLSPQMEINSVQDILNLLISSAFRRCRMLDDLCRLSVSLKPTRSLVLISGTYSSLNISSIDLWTVSFNILISVSTVSDTGTGNILEEFSQFDYKNNTILSGKWAKLELRGQLLIVLISTDISTYFELHVNSVTDMGFFRQPSSTDREIHHLKFDLKEVVASRRLVRLPSVTKSGAKFRQSEIDVLVTMLHLYLQKILLLKAFKIAIELMVESGGGTKSYFLQNACRTPATNDVNSYNLTLGLEEYVSKHGNKLAEACHSCFSTGSVLMIKVQYHPTTGLEIKNLKVGSGVACSRENHQNLGQVMEVVIIISNVSMLDQSSCSRLYGRRTEVLYFKDFSPCSMPQSSLEALNSIDWKNYGLVLKSVGDQDGITILETLPCSRSNRTDRYLTRKALKLALSDLKKRNAGTLLSERAVKICNYAPDLAKTISGLIMSSLDLNFKRECLSLLGLPSPEHEKDIVETCIKDKIISVIATNDSGSRRGTLFEHGPKKSYEGVVEYFDA